LFGTNFDASVVNQDMLEGIPGEMFHFKATNEGKDFTLSCLSNLQQIYGVCLKWVYVEYIFITQQYSFRVHNTSSEKQYELAAQVHKIMK
jgi:hypothetical protein